MNYGTPKDWAEYNCNITLCGKCDNTAAWIWRGGICVICNDCYQKLVVTPNLKPLTKEDLSDDLIDKEVVCVDNINLSTCLILSNTYRVIDLDPDGYIKIRDEEKDITYYKSSRFVLPAEAPADAPKPQIYDEVGETPKPPREKFWSFSTPTQPEVTHSCELEFPNGETVTVPGPEGPGWTAETTRYDWPQKYYKDLWTKVQSHDVKHSNGKLIFNEYAVRMHNENARIVSLTKWIPDPNYTPPEREETFEERARRRYPSRMRGV